MDCLLDRGIISISCIERRLGEGAFLYSFLVLLGTAFSALLFREIHCTECIHSLLDDCFDMFNYKPIDKASGWSCIFNPSNSELCIMMDGRTHAHIVHRMNVSCCIWNVSELPCQFTKDCSSLGSFVYNVRL